MRAIMSNEEYRQALDELGLTHDQAAETLGIGRRSSVRYASRGAPKYIALALEALRSRLEAAE
jgi:hypothetical protein